MNTNEQKLYMAEMDLSRLRVLLVEDHPTNQQLAFRNLEKLGISAPLAQNGRQAVERFAAGAFEVMLMDCQMPEMDGYQATREIRRLESQPGHARPRVHIIAVTARAMTGDREACLAAGMDDYLTKPLKSIHLRQALERFILQRGPAPAAAPSSGEEYGESVENEIFTAANALAGDLGPEAVQEIAALYLHDTPSSVRLLRELLAANRAREFFRAAHSLRGSSSLFGLRKIQELCGQLEDLGRAENLVEAPPLLEVLERELDSAYAALQRCLSHYQSQLCPA